VRDVLHEVDFQKSNKTELGILQEAKTLRPSHYRSTWLEQFSATLWRAYLDTKRNPNVTKIFVGQLIVSDLFKSA